MDMNGYNLTDKLRKARRREHLTAVEQALFYELVAVCNDEGWSDSFECSNSELCYALNITEKTLIKARENLINAELIYYRSGKSKRKFGTYSFIKDFKTTVKNTAVSTVDSMVVSTVDDIAKPPYLYKTKTEIETEREILPLPPYFEIKEKIISDQMWLDVVLQQSGLTPDDAKHIPGQIDKFFNLQISLGRIDEAMTEKDAKRMFTYWWNDKGLDEFKTERYWDVDHECEQGSFDSLKLWIKDNAPNIMALRNQLTGKEFDQLMEIAKTKKILVSVFSELNNDAFVLKNKLSVFESWKSKYEKIYKSK